MSDELDPIERMPFAELAEKLAKRFSASIVIGMSDVKNGNTVAMYGALELLVDESPRAVGYMFDKLLDQAYQAADEASSKTGTVLIATHALRMVTTLHAVAHALGERVIEESKKRGMKITNSPFEDAEDE